MNETGRLIAVVLLASFAIERVGAAVAFVLGKPKPEKRRERQVLLFCISAVLGAVVVGLSGIRILMALQIVAPARGLDFFLTWLVLAGGADRIREIIGDTDKSGEGSRKEVAPIQILIADHDGEVTVKELPDAS